MKHADRPRADPRRERLLVLEPRSGALTDRVVGDLPSYLAGPDVIVVNAAATLPASFPARLGPGDSSSSGRGPGSAEGPAASIEVRLAGSASGDGDWWAVLFGDGTWRIPTEHRPPPPRVSPGDELTLSDELHARVLEVSSISPRLVRLVFDREGDDLLRAFYRLGRPVQYSYLCCDLELWDVQTRYGARPWSVELPSAGRPLTWDTLAALRGRGVTVVELTHAAGLSSTGDAELDARLPLPERYEIPEATVAAIASARSGGGRVIAVGTSVVRALEGNAAAHGGALVAGAGITDLILGRGTSPRIVDGLLTGVHEPGSSHLRLLEAFASRQVLETALAHAEEHGFLQHEFGDSMLVLPPSGRIRDRLSGLRSDQMSHARQRMPTASETTRAPTPNRIARGRSRMRNGRARAKSTIPKSSLSGKSRIWSTSHSPPKTSFKRNTPTSTKRMKPRISKTASLPGWPFGRRP